MKYLGYVLCGLTGATTAGYFFVYLHRWEWHRAMISGVLLLAVEILLVCAVLLARIARLERQLSDSGTRTEDVWRRLEQSRTDHGAGGTGQFHWLDSLRTDGTRDSYVFVPVLMAAGAVLSGVAWVVQRLAAATFPGTGTGTGTGAGTGTGTGTGTAAERRLARRLSRLTAPAGGVRGGAGATLEEREAVPRVRTLRAVTGGVTAIAGVLLLGVLAGGLADVTQTRPEPRPRSAATTVVFQVAVRPPATAGARESAARELWETCRRSTSRISEHAALAQLDDTVWAATMRPALTGHDLMRLRGCLQDSTANRARAEVLGGGQAPPHR